MIPPTDVDRALAIVGFLCHATHETRYIVVDGEPMSKARPRFGGGGRVYTPTKQRDAAEALGWRLRTLFPDPWDGNIAVGCVFFRSSRQRVDVDNMLKQVLDAATGICFHNDDQVTAQAAFVELDREQPRTIIVFGRHQSTMDRSSDPGQAFACAQCGRDFWAYRRTGGKAPVYCSRSCRAAATRRAAGTGICDTCGKRLSKPAYQRCRDCWRSRGRRQLPLEAATG